MEYTKEVNMTYFHKIKKISIEDVMAGDIVYLRVDTHNGLANLYDREVYGKITKKTNCFFEILEYEMAFCRIIDCPTENIVKREANPEKHSKKWAKKSVLDIWSIETEQRVELRTYHSNK